MAKRPFSQIFFNMASIEQAIAAADTARQAFERFPKAQGHLAVDGFDDDPPQLDQIPEALPIIKAFAERLSDYELAHFEEGSVGLLLVALGRAQRVGDGIHVPLSEVMKMGRALKQGKGSG